MHEIVVFNSLVDRAWYFFFNPDRLPAYRVRNGRCPACAEGKPLRDESFHDPVTGITTYAPTEHIEATFEHPDPMRI